MSRRRFSLKMTPRSGSIWSGGQRSAGPRSRSGCRCSRRPALRRRAAGRAGRRSGRSRSAHWCPAPKASPARCRNATNSPGARFCRALEGHVLEEMGEAALALALHERAGLDQQAQADPVRRRALRQDGVAHAVGQPAPGHRRVMGEHAVGAGGQGGRGSRAASGARGQHQPDADQQAAGRGQGMRRHSCAARRRSRADGDIARRASRCQRRPMNIRLAARRACCADLATVAPLEPSAHPCVLALEHHITHRPIQPRQPHLRAHVMRKCLRVTGLEPGPAGT